MAFKSAQEAAAYFALEHWEERHQDDEYGPPAPTSSIWSDSKDNYRLEILGPPPFIVVCAQSENDWQGIDSCHCYFGPNKVIAKSLYTESGELIVTIYRWQLIQQGVKTVKVICEGQERICPVIYDDIVFYPRWHTDVPDNNPWQPGEFCLFIDDKLVWDAAKHTLWLGTYLATVDDLVRDYPLFLRQEEAKLAATREKIDNWQSRHKTDLDWIGEFVDAYPLNCGRDNGMAELKVTVALTLLEAIKDPLKDLTYLTEDVPKVFAGLDYHWLCERLGKEARRNPKLMIALHCVPDDDDIFSEDESLTDKWEDMCGPFRWKFRSGTFEENVRKFLESKIK